MNSLWVHRIAALWHQVRGRKDRSFVHHTVILDHDPTDFNALMVVVSSLQHEGRLHEALQTSGRALAVEPEHYLALRYAACIAAKLDLYDEAKGYAERLLRAAPDMQRNSAFLKVFDNFYRMLHWLGRLLHPRRRVNSPPEPPSLAASRDVERNAEWARQYLAWHARTVAGPSMPFRMTKPSNSR